LGTGDVVVSGSLVLNGSSNIASAASVTIHGTVSNAPGVKVRISSITTNGITHTTGLFRYGVGDFRLPATNQMPVCVLTNPVHGAQFSTGDALPLRVSATDADSYIARVEFFVNDAKIGERTTPPYTAFWPGATNGAYGLHAVATDDDGGVTTAAVVTVTVGDITPATLTWSAAVSRDWNTETANWTGSRTVFHAGDSVIFTNTGAGTNFIGAATIPIGVAPASVIISTPSNYVFSGGGIISNATLLKQGTGTATFNGYTNLMKDALSFAGGTTLRGGIVRWNVDTRGGGAQTGAFGRAGLVLDGGSFHIGNTGTPTFHLTNAVTVTSNGGTLGAATSQQASGQTLPNLRFTGPIALGGSLRIGQVVGGGGNAPGPHYDGTITIDQSAPGLRQLTLTGGGNSGPTLNAPIVDGPGSASNALIIASADSGNGRAATITGVHNQYSGGTIFTNVSGTFSVVLATNATLGAGDVTIRSGASVTFQTGGGLKSNAALNVQGRLSLLTNVIVKVRELTLGPDTYTSGNYSNANGGGYLLGGGSVRVGGTNDAPSIAITNPVNGEVFGNGANIPVRTNARDDDGAITNVLIWAGTNLIANLTTPPWSITWSNVPGGTYSLTARAYDHEGASTLSDPVLIEVLNFNFEIYTASYLSGGTNHDRGEAVDIAPDGTVVWAGTLTVTNYGRTPVELLGGGDGAVLRLNTNGTEVLSITRLGARVDDMEVDRQTGNLAVIGATVSGATTNCFLGVLNPDATAFVWQTWLTPSGGGASDSDDPGRRVAMASDGTVAALHGKHLSVFAADGTLIGTRSHGNSFVNDVAIDATTKSVFLCGFDNKNLPGDNACPGCPVQVAFLYSYAYTNWTGAAQWINWGWPGSALNGNEADARAYRLCLGRDGYLYMAGESAGGNSIYRWNPKDLNASGNIITYDMYNTAYNTGANHITYYCRMDPSNGDVLKGQFALARLTSTAGNTIRPRAIAADEGGYVYVGGSSAYQIQNRSAQRINGQLVPPYSGGDSFLLIVQPDFLLRKTWTVFSGPGDATEVPPHNSYIRSLAAGNGTAALASTLLGLAITTSNAIQALPHGNPGSTNTEGYVAVWQSQQGKLPVITLTTPDNFADESGTNTATFTFTRGFATFQYLTIQYVIGGTASNGVDYVAITNSIAIAPGATATNLTLTPLADTVWETNEWVVLTLSSNLNYIIGFPPANTVTIAGYPINDWRQLVFTPAEYADLAISGPLADPDGDGYVNLLEYAFDRDPKVAETQRLVTYAIETNPADGHEYLVLASPRRKVPLDIVYEPQQSANLTAWNTDAPFIEEFATNSLNPTLEEVRFRIHGPVHATPIQHGRLLVTVGPDTKAAEVVSAKRIILGENQNYVAVPVLPATNFLATLLDTNRLGAAETEAGATVVDFWDQAAQVLTQRLWNSNAPGFEGWRHSATFGDGHTHPVDPNKGLIVTLRQGQGPRTNYLTGYLPRRPQIQTIQNNGYTLVGSQFPAATAVSNANLLAAGFVGGTSLVTSDRLLFFNPATQQFDTKIWFDSVSGVWRDQTAAIATNALEPGAAVLIHRRDRAAGHITWTNPVPYPLPDVAP
jgi:hypothetical protein